MAKRWRGYNRNCSCISSKKKSLNRRSSSSGSRLSTVSIRTRFILSFFFFFTTSHGRPRNFLSFDNFGLARLPGILARHTEKVNLISVTARWMHFSTSRPMPLPDLVTVHYLTSYFVLTTYMSSWAVPSIYVASIATAFFPALHISLYHFNILVLLTWDGLLATVSSTMRYTGEVPIDYSKIYSDASPPRDPEILSTVKFHFVRWFRVAFERIANDGK